MLYLMTKFSLDWFEQPISLKVEEIPRSEARTIVEVADEFGNFKSAVWKSEEYFVMVQQLQHEIAHSMVKKRVNLTKNDCLLVAIYQGTDLSHCAAGLVSHEDKPFKYYLVIPNKEENDNA